MLPKAEFRTVEAILTTRTSHQTMEVLSAAMKRAGLQPTVMVRPSVPSDPSSSTPASQQKPKNVDPSMQEKSEEVASVKHQLEVLYLQAPLFQG